MSSFDEYDSDNNITNIPAKPIELINSYAGLRAASNMRRAHTSFSKARPLLMQPLGREDLHNLVMKITRYTDSNKMNIASFEKIDQIISYQNNLNESDVHELIDLLSKSHPKYDEFHNIQREILSKLIFRYPKYSKKL